MRYANTHTDKQMLGQKELRTVNIAWKMWEDLNK
jgi:hypothetical protein